VQVRFLRSGVYAVSRDGSELGVRTSEDLEQGVIVNGPGKFHAHIARDARIAPSLPRVGENIRLIRHLPQRLAGERGAAGSRPSHSNLREGSQFPRWRDLAERHQPIQKVSASPPTPSSSTTLDRQYRGLYALAGIAEDIPASGPRPSLNLTIFCDGECQL
jgi:hypothetical protein